MEAVKGGRSDEVEELLFKEKWPVHYGHVDSIGDSLLHMAVRLGHHEVVCKLAELSFTKPNRDGQSPVALAVTLNQVDCLRVLLKNDDYSPTEEREENALLNMSVLLGHSECTRLLQEKERMKEQKRKEREARDDDLSDSDDEEDDDHMDETKTEEKVFQQLWKAIRCEPSSDSVMSFVETATAGNHNLFALMTTEGNSLLHIACKMKRSAICASIVRASMRFASPNNVVPAPNRAIFAPNNEGLSPLGIAASLGCASIVRLLLITGHNPLFKSSGNPSPLEIAKIKKHLDCQVLMETHVAGAHAQDAKYKEEEFGAAFEACLADFDEVDNDEVDNSKKIISIISSQKCSDDDIVFLLETLDKDVSCYHRLFSCQWKNNTTPLHVACCTRKSAACAILMRAAHEWDQPDPFDILDRDGFSPLGIATSLDCASIVRLLLAAGHDRLLGPEGRKPMEIAFAKELPDCMQLMTTEFENKDAEFYAAYFACLREAGVDLGEGEGEWEGEGEREGEDEGEGEREREREGNVGEGEWEVEVEGGMYEGGML